jgi:NADH-quinone oxidoreductase subunit M
MIAALASLGLPGLSNFPGEFLVILGAFLSRNAAYAAIAAIGVVFAAIYVLWLYGNVMQGSVEKPKVQEMHDLTLREVLVLAPVIIFIVLMGVFPGIILSRTSASANQLVTTIRNARKAEATFQQKPKTARVGDSDTSSYPKGGRVQ